MTYCLATPAEQERLKLFGVNQREEYRGMNFVVICLPERLRQIIRHVFDNRTKDHCTVVRHEPVGGRPHIYEGGRITSWSSGSEPESAVVGFHMNGVAYTDGKLRDLIYSLPIAEIVEFTFHMSNR